ncbi:choice-of-anchor D domain-containing protein [Myxococcota bacterium]|nr:choice-of-anchor D domain-containing protein [Myxococcota bacterium]
MYQTAARRAAAVATLLALATLAACGPSPRGDRDDDDGADDDSWVGDDDAADDDAADDDAADDDAADDDAADDDAADDDTADDDTHASDDDTGPGDDDVSPDDDTADDDTAPSADLQISPASWSYGEVGVGCVASQGFVVSNEGGASATIASIGLTGGLASVASLTTSGTSPGSVIPPGGSGQVWVEFEPEDEATYSGALSITPVGQPARTASLSGEGAYGGVRTDTFEQTAAGAVDVLWVMDNSCSMSEEQSTIATRFETFLDEANDLGLDYHLSVITTDNANLRSSGGVKVITPTTANAALVFTTLITAGTSGSATEMGIEMAYQALQPAATGGVNAGFLRSDALLHAVFISDERDQSSGSLSDYQEYFEDLKGDPDRFVASGIIGLNASGMAASCSGPTGTAEGGTGYWTLVDATEGAMTSICSSDWGVNLAEIASASAGGGPRLSFVLSEEAVAGSVDVEVDGLPAAGWSYDAALNAVVFIEAYAPEEGAVIEVTYAMPAAC